jgi:hypothetical protein
MHKIIPEIDSIVKEVSDKMLDIYEEFQQQNPDIKADYSKGAAIIVFRLGLDYFVAARDTLHKGGVISGGSLVRTALENIADLFYIYDKPDKYPMAYVESMEQFRKIMVKVAQKDYNVLAQSRELKQANKWTKASIEDRIKASGNSFLNIYDLLSYFGHPNPGSLTYITNKNLKAGQLNLLKQANCKTALTLMGVVLNHSDIVKTNVEELDVIARKLGTQLIPDK